MKLLVHVHAPHTGLIDALPSTGAVCDEQPAGGWVNPPRRANRLWLYWHIFSSVESSSSLPLRRMRENLSLERGERIHSVGKIVFTS